MTEAWGLSKNSDGALSEMGSIKILFFFSLLVLSLFIFVVEVLVYSVQRQKKINFRKKPVESAILND
jgi:hypothetical protein